MNIEKIKIKKIYLIIIFAMFIATSFAIGYSKIEKGITIAEGTINYREPNECNQNNLYDRIACNSVLDNIYSRYTDNAGISFVNKNDTKNGHGVYEFARTKQDQFPIYYYRGDVENNNVRFGDFCWMIVRTTSNGGTKLIYSGEIDENGQCTDDNVAIGSTKYNLDDQIGYKYGEPLIKEKKQVDFMVDVFMTGWVAEHTYFNDFYYSDSYTYSEETNTYTLENPAKVSRTRDVRNKYTCFKENVNDQSCSTMYYIFEEGFIYTNYYAVPIINGQSKLTAGYYYSDEYKLNDDGTYTLENPKFMPYTRAEAYSYDSAIAMKGKYYCDGGVTTCSTLKFRNAKPRGNIHHYFDSDHEFEFGKSISLNNDIYTLNNIYREWDIYNNWNIIMQEYPYVIINNKPYYIIGYTESDNDLMDKFDLVEITSPLLTYEDTLARESANINDSNIKTMIEQWYEDNLSSLTNKIEDEVYCNDRRLKYNYDIDYYVTERLENGALSFTCDDNDSFTVSSSNGNGELNYPIGLLTTDEAVLTGLRVSFSNSNTSYLTTCSDDFFLMSPYNYKNSKSAIFNYNSEIKEYSPSSEALVRPVITLKNNVVIVSGDGTYENPYVVN